MVKLKTSPILWVVLLFITSCGQNTTSEQSCKLWAKISRGEYILTNNVWGAEGQKDYRQCISVSGSHEAPVYQWSWNWQGREGNVIAYPSILYGHKPWNPASTSSKLPIQIRTLDTLKAHYRIQQQGEGSHNILLESWVTSSRQPQPSTRTAEIAIHLFQQNWPGMPGKLIDTVEIDGGNYDFYVDPKIIVPGDELRWPYLGFVRKGPFQSHGTVDMAAFVRFLLQRGYLSPEHYLVSVELGSELVKGTGQTTVKTFGVEF